MSRVSGRGNGYELHMIHNVRPAVEQSRPPTIARIAPSGAIATSAACPTTRIVEAHRADHDLRHPNRFRCAVAHRAQELKRNEAAITAALRSWLRSRACRDGTLNRCQISAERMRCRQAHS
jgi:hypothetical protein